MWKWIESFIGILELSISGDLYSRMTQDVDWRMKKCLCKVFLTQFLNEESGMFDNFVGEHPIVGKKPHSRKKPHGWKTPHYRKVPHSRKTPQRRKIPHSRRLTCRRKICFTLINRICLRMKYI